MPPVRSCLLAMLTALLPLYLAISLIPELATDVHLLLTGMLIIAVLMGWAIHFDKRR